MGHLDNLITPDARLLWSSHFAQMKDLSLFCKKAFYVFSRQFVVYTEKNGHLYGSDVSTPPLAQLWTRAGEASTMHFSGQECVQTQRIGSFEVSPRFPYKRSATRLLYIAQQHQIKHRTLQMTDVACSCHDDGWGGLAVMTAADHICHFQGFTSRQ